MCRKLDGEKGERKRKAFLLFHVCLTFDFYLIFPQGFLWFNFNDAVFRFSQTSDCSSRHVSGIPVRVDYRWFFVLALMSLDYGEQHSHLLVENAFSEFYFRIC
jgi:hypothetical protein